jgi:hypothetical protein
MRRLMSMAAVGAALALATPASAAITITPSPGAVQPAENVLADTSITGTTVMGTTNQTNTMVSILSLNGESLTSTTSNGQSRFASTDGSLDTARIFLTQGGTFTQAEFNLFNALETTSTVSIIINGVAQTFNLGNGENFFGIQATGTDTISSIAFDTNGIGVVDLRQLRIGGVAAAVPEPATWALMLIGFGAAGFAMRRSRKQQRGVMLQVA